MKEALFNNRFAAVLYALALAVADFVKTAYKAVVQAVTPRITLAFGAIKRIPNVVAMLVQSNGFSIMRVSALVLFTLIVVVTAQAQDTGGIDTTSPDTLIGSIDWLYGALVVIGGYLSAFIPFFKKITNGTYRVLAWAVLVGVGFVMFGFGDVINLAITYAMSTSLYEVILKWFAKSPSPGTGGGG